MGPEKLLSAESLMVLSGRSLEDKIAKNNADNGEIVQRGTRIFVLTQLGLFVTIFAKNLCAWEWRNAVIIQELSTTEVKLPCLKSRDNRNMFPGGQHREAAKGAGYSLSFKQDLTMCKHCPHTVLGLEAWKIKG